MASKYTNWRMYFDVRHRFVTIPISADMEGWKWRWCAPLLRVGVVRWREVRKAGKGNGSTHCPTQRGDVALGLRRSSPWRG